MKDIYRKTATAEEVKQEAIERMKLLKLNKQIINEFEKLDKIYVSEIKGNLQKANDEQLEMVKEYEEKKQVRIYHIIHQKTESKDISFFLYVDPNSKEWKAEKRDIELGYECALCFKQTKEIRELGIKVKDGKVNTIVV